MKKIVVLISGDGSNLQAIINACKKQKIFAKISAVFSDNPSAYGLKLAQKASIPIIIIPKTYIDKYSYDIFLMMKLDKYQPDLIVLAGYMRILTPYFVNNYLGKIINIHPSLLPKYPGLNTHQKALLNGDEEHGTSIHFVTNQLDSGPIILQSKVPIFPNDKIQDIITRVKTQEHIIYPLVINWFIKDRLTIINNLVFLDGCKLPKYGYLNNK
ncbi:MAG: phosphoribosylglycinamide formyltransferase [Arsenophonus endosymbiont of Ceratovacuna japonica]